MATGFPIIFQRPLWTPAQASPSMWLDASDARTITLNGSTVSQWDDKSGNRINATQSTAARQPTYTTNGLNGNPVLTFNTSSFSSTANVNGLSSFMFYIVAKASTGSNYTSMLRFQTSTSKYFSYTWAGTSAATIISETDATAPTGMASGLVNNAWNIGAVRRVQNQANGFASYNNGTFVEGKTSPNSAFECGQLTIGSYIGTSEYFSGTIAEIVLFYTANDDVTRQRMEGYLAWKWGLESSLPNNHPYKNSPPRQ